MTQPNAPTKIAIVRESGELTHVSWIEHTERGLVPCVYFDTSYPETYGRPLETIADCEAWIRNRVATQRECFVGDWTFSHTHHGLLHCNLRNTYMRTLEACLKELEPVLFSARRA